jgi:hypothetical protein
LPSGRVIYYNSPYLEDGKYGLEPRHKGLNPKTKQWCNRSLIPGRITENIVQATAREVMAYGLLNIWEYMPEIYLIGTVHDEALGLVLEALYYEMPEILEDFLYFLNGCSFTYVKDLIFVKETGEEVGVIEWEQDIRDTETSDDLINEIDILVEKMNNASGQ